MTAILACRPVTLDLSDEFDKECLDLPLYPGSVTADCEGCTRLVYVAPNLQSVWRSDMPTCLLCARCVVTVMSRDGIPRENIIDLGKPGGV